ncbi:MAG: sugar ABC transporter substrate-binding protein, partial [Lachnospiraceae bacterium]|nr:sugar ABC transporter substrate-binding protein [Lachnospiraceae bacterium]
MKLRKVLALVMAGMMTCSLAACGGGSSDGGSDASSDSAEKTETADDGAEEKTESSGSDVTLSVAIWDNNQAPGLQEIIDDFTAKTGIQTKLSVVKWDEYWT